MHLVCNLSDLSVGDSAEVLSIETEQAAYRQRLFAFGIVPGVQISIKRRAPLGDPMEVEIKNCNSFILRRKETSLIQVRRVNPCA